MNDYEQWGKKVVLALTALGVECNEQNASGMIVFFVRSLRNDFEVPPPAILKLVVAAMGGVCEVVSVKADRPSTPNN